MNVALDLFAGTIRRSAGSLPGSSDFSYAPEKCRLGWQMRRLLAMFRKNPKAGSMPKSASSYNRGCLVCGGAPLIQAHLMPKVFVKEVLVGISIAANVREDGAFDKSQRGIWDPNILCGPCDQHIGRIEHIAANELSRIRRICAQRPFGPCAIPEFDGNQFIRFSAALLWKYSVTRPMYGRISPGPYRTALRQLAFDDAVVPVSIDAFIFRPLLSPGDESVALYRAPLPDRKNLINLFRLFVGGCLIFVRVDKRPQIDQTLAPFSVRDRVGIQVNIVPADMLEEFRLPQLMIKSPRLSSFLDEQEANFQSKDS